jgi:hypothetical protein
MLDRLYLALSDIFTLDTKSKDHSQSERWQKTTTFGSCKEMRFIVNLKSRFQTIFIIFPVHDGG